MKLQTRKQMAVNRADRFNRAYERADRAKRKHIIKMARKLIYRNMDLEDDATQTE